MKSVWLGFSHPPICLPLSAGIVVGLVKCFHVVPPALVLIGATVPAHVSEDSPWRGLEVKGSLAEHGCALGSATVIPAAVYLA